MTTATAPAPLTAADVRRAIIERASEYPNDNGSRPLRAVVEHVFDVIDWYPADDRLDPDDPDRSELGDDIFRNLRPAEALRLKAIIAEHRDRGQARALEVLREECIAAALAFAAEYPDVPRAMAGQVR